MKRFEYNLETVLAYKTQVLDSLKTEHAVILETLNHKQEEIQSLNGRLSGFESGFDKTKSMGASIEHFRLCDMCIGRMEDIISKEQERLCMLKQKEEGKKKEVITAKVDTSKFEKLKDRKMCEHQKAVVKEEDAFVEEFVIRTMTFDPQGGK